jgi:hypothetical protein
MFGLCDVICDVIGVDRLQVVFDLNSSSLGHPYNVRGTTYCNL